MSAETFKFSSGLNLDRVGTALDENDSLHVCVKPLNGNKIWTRLKYVKCVRTREARPIRRVLPQPDSRVNLSLVNAFSSCRTGYKVGLAHSARGDGPKKR